MGGSGALGSDGGMVVWLLVEDERTEERGGFERR